MPVQPKYGPGWQGMGFKCERAEGTICRSLDLNLVNEDQFATMANNLEGCLRMYAASLADLAITKIMQPDEVRPASSNRVV